MVSDIEFVKELERRIPKHQGFAKIIKKAQFIKKLCHIGEIIGFAGFVVAVLFYPIYWLAHFIIWSIRTLRQREGT